MQQNAFIGKWTGRSSLRPRVAVIALLLMALAMVGGANPSQAQVQSRDRRTIDEIAHVYHGIAVDRQMRPIQITPAVLLDMLDDLVETSAATGSPINRRQLLGARASLLRPRDLSPFAQMVLRGTLADRALATAPRSVRERVGWRLDFLFARSRALQFERGPNDSRLRSRGFGLDSFLQSLLEFTRWFAREVAERRYSIDCRLGGVPLPPDWSSTRWVLQGTLPQSRLFLELGDPVQVYAYADPNVPGACIALPRWEGASVTLGIICQGANTGNACFWDNRPHGGGAPFTQAQMMANSVQRDWVNGRDAALVGGGQCTSCHRGNNVFLIHPNSALAVSAPFNISAGTTWYRPITSLGWINPPATAFGSGGGCTGCHQIGATTGADNGSYCAIVRRAAEREMPSLSSPAGWSTPKASYAAHINALRANCPP